MCVLFLAEFVLQRLGDDVRRYLRQYHWPGNVRELENLIERACLLSRNDSIEVEDLHLGLGSRTHGASGREAPFNRAEPVTLEEMERRLIMATLDKTGGNRTRTADLLGVSVRTIRNKLNQYDLNEPTPS